MNAQRIINSRFGIETALWLGRHLPVRVGYAVADLVAGIISSRRKLSPVRAVRANQYIIHEQKVVGEDLDRLVHATFRTAARSLFDFYHWMDDPQALMTQVVVEPSFQDRIHQVLRQESGVIITLPHVGNADLIGRGIALRGMRFQAITPPAPPGGYQVLNQLRTKVGIDITPASLEAVRLATQRLRAGGCVVTGADRPLPEAKLLPRFFGFPAPVPTAHIRLALRLELPVYVACSFQSADGCYHIRSSDPIPMQHFSDPEEEVIVNAEVILKLIEQNICDYSVQWNMTYPVWPDLFDDVP